MDSPDTRSPEDRLAAWREQGADRHDPAGFALLQALARRLPGLQGHARTLTEARLAQRLQAYEAGLPDATASPATATPAARPLDALLAHLAARAPLREEPGDVGAAFPELPMLDEVRALWSRLNAEKQLRQSIEQLPENAGPLNSDHVVLRALTHMQALSPDYLHHFMAYGETLAWLERMSPVPAATGKDGKPAAKTAPRTRKARPRENAAKTPTE